MDFPNSSLERKDNQVWKNWNFGNGHQFSLIFFCSSLRAWVSPSWHWASSSFSHCLFSFSASACLSLHLFHSAFSLLLAMLHCCVSVSMACWSLRPTSLRMFCCPQTKEKQNLGVQQDLDFSFWWKNEKNAGELSIGRIGCWDNCKVGRSKRLHHFTYSYMDHILGMLHACTIQKGILAFSICEIERRKEVLLPAHTPAAQLVGSTLVPQRATSKPTTHVCAHTLPDAQWIE